jgi:ketosteroid isomerase-like protein
MGQTLDITERWWSAFMAGKLDEAASLYADDVSFRGPGVEFNSGAAMKPYLEGFAKEFDFASKTVKAVVEQGDKLFMELELVLTHKASKKVAKIYATDSVRVVNGKIVAWAAYWDRAGFGGQLQ